MTQTAQADKIAKQFFCIVSELVYRGLVLIVLKSGRAPKLVRLSATGNQEDPNTQADLDAVRAFCDRHTVSLAELAQDLDVGYQESFVVTLAQRIQAGMERLEASGAVESMDFWEAVRDLEIQIRAHYFILEWVAYGFIAIAWHERCCASAQGDQ